jgi:hypothetical protein
MTAIGREAGDHLIPRLFEGGIARRAAEDSTEILIALAEVLPETERKRAAVLAEQINEPWSRARALRELARFAAPPLRERLVTAALSAAHACTDRKPEALLATADLLEEPMKTSLKQEAITAAAGATLPKGLFRYTFVKFLLTVARESAEPFRTNVLAEALREARELNPGTNVTWLLQTARHLSPSSAHAVRREALSIARSLKPEHHQSENLIEVAQERDASLQPEILAATAEIKDEHLRSRTLAAMVPLLPQELLQAVDDAARRMASDDTRGTVLQALNMRFQAITSTTTQAGLESVSDTKDASLDLVEKIAALLAALSHDQRREVLKEQFDAIDRRERARSVQRFSKALEAEAIRLEPARPVRFEPRLAAGPVVLHPVSKKENILSDVNRPANYIPPVSLPVIRDPQEETAEPVQLGAQVPRAVHAGQEFSASFVAHGKDDDEYVRVRLDGLAPTARTLLGLKRYRWRRGTRVTVALSGQHLSVTPPSQEFEWSGQPEFLDFDVRVDDGANGDAVTLRFDISVEGFAVGRLRPAIPLRAERVGDERITIRGVPVQTAFASYAWEDRDRVGDAVAALVSIAGIDVFMDVTHLRAGERWRPTLRSEIENREVFILFWSRSASASDWVDWEWRTALQQKGFDGIRVRPLEPATLAPPPLELAELNFGDLYSSLQRRAETAPRPE